MRQDKLFSKFVAVGVMNTAVGYSFYALFIYIGVSYPLAVLFSTILGVLFNFKSIGKLVFSHKENANFLRFALVYTVIYVLNVLGLWAFEQIGLHNKYIAGAILLVPLAVISFILNKKIVFI